MKLIASCRNQSPPVVQFVLIAAMVLLFQGTGWAEAIQITGTTTGAFSGDAGGLQYTGGAFDVLTTSGGYAGIGGATDSLGTFTLGTTPFSYFGTFNLLVTIGDPAGSGAGSTALPIFLSVEPSGSGGATIIGSQSPMYFTFPAVGGETGHFWLQVAALNLTPGQSASLTGSIIGATGVPVPESYDLALVGFGMLAAVIAGIRRRRIA
jgi:hypothetical protein